MASASASSFRELISFSFACSPDIPEMASSCSICCFLILSNSAVFFSINSFCTSMLLCWLWSSFPLRCISSSLREISVSCCFNLFSAINSLLFLAAACFSCSALICKNFSLAWRILSFLITSASASASLMIFCARYFMANLIINQPIAIPTNKAITLAIIVVIVIFLLLIKFII